MELKDFFLEQLEREATASRKVLDRVPEGRNNWKPHDKSMELGYLAALVATMPGWVTLMIERDELNLDDPANESFKTKPVETKAELLKALEDSLDKGRRSLQDATDAHLMKPWRFVYGGQVLYEASRYVMLADTCFAHLAHHRGQLTVYLRLNEASVPALYGPSADERN